MQLEMPHVNVLSKIDLLSTYGDLRERDRICAYSQPLTVILAFDLRYYAECRDLSYLLSSQEKEPLASKYRALNRAMVYLIEDSGLVGFETLAVEVSFAQAPYSSPAKIFQDKMSMLKVLRVLDKVTGYIFVPNAISTGTEDTHDLSRSAMTLADQDLGDVDDAQERWLDRKEEYDEVEREAWKREGEMRAQAGAS